MIINIDCYILIRIHNINEDKHIFVTKPSAWRPRVATGSVGTTIKLHSYRVHHSKLKLCSFLVKFVSVWCKHISNYFEYHTLLNGSCQSVPSSCSGVSHWSRAVKCKCFESNWLKYSVSS